MCPGAFLAIPIRKSEMGYFLSSVRFTILASLSLLMPPIGSPFPNAVCSLELRSWVRLEAQKARAACILSLSKFLPTKQTTKLGVSAGRDLHERGGFATLENKN